MANPEKRSAADVIAATRAVDGRADGNPRPVCGAGRSDGVDHGRRWFGFWLGFVSLGTTLGLWLLATVRFMFPNVVRELPTRVKVGYPADYAPGHVETRFKNRYGLWVVRGQYHGQPQIYALKAVCTHMGCTPNWLEAEQKFKCPCHGSGFAQDGENLEGPAPRPLERYAIRLADDGQIEIDKAKTFREELGQWQDPACYVRV
jgi:cytochrome b6-f complex iron-sulfur subunit